jgi:hypothetical protein
VDEACKLVTECYREQCWDVRRSSAAFDLADAPPPPPARPDRAARSAQGAARGGVEE